MYRKTFVEIDLEKLKNNIKKIIKTYNQYKYYLGVVKNNAYGHGFEVIDTMIEAGINYFCVSSLEEALLIREKNKKVPILILEPIEYDAFKVASQNNITITIDDVNSFKYLLANKIKIKYHLKIDTGMNRFGLKNSQDIEYIVSHSNNDVYLEGIYTHLKSGVETSTTYNNSLNMFKELTKNIDLNKIEIVHFDRSLTLEQHKKIDITNGCRLGILMYGFANNTYNPSLKRKIYNYITGKKIVNSSPLNLETVFSFKSKVIEIKNIKAGEDVGYGGMFKASKDAKIAIVPYGFGDYLYDDLSPVSINNKLYNPIVINMDVTIILIDENVKIGDTVEIFGENISIRKKARDINQNVYKLLTSITSRVPRVYKGKNR